MHAYTMIECHAWWLKVLREQLNWQLKSLSSLKHAYLFSRSLCAYLLLLKFIYVDGVTQVEAILDKDNFTLEELLDEEEVIQECKALNSRLINLYVSV